MLGTKGEDSTVIKGTLVEDADLFATFDGHGGKEVSGLAAEHFHKILAETLERNPDPEEALRSAFADLNTLVKIEVENNNIGKKAGSTAVAALLYKNQLYVANIGDSRAVSNYNL
jgi:serine/threonine protein phosphatase PrpC